MNWSKNLTKFFATGNAKDVEGGSLIMLTYTIELIATERERQIIVEGWTPEHDDKYRNNELIRAAIAYLEADSHGKLGHLVSPMGWPWDESWWKPTPHDRIRELVKAGALIAAEIERLQRKGS